MASSSSLHGTNRKFSVDFEVMELATGPYSLFLGLPTLLLFGIGLHGLPIATPSLANSMLNEVTEIDQPSASQMLSSGNLPLISQRISLSECIESISNNKHDLGE
jgi:hypothetical protein